MNIRNHHPELKDLCQSITSKNQVCNSEGIHPGCYICGTRDYGMEIIFERKKQNPY